MLQMFRAVSFIWILFLFASSLSAKPVILSIGDSLTFGLGVAEDKTWPRLLQNKLQADGMKEAKVINAGSSGATTAFGLTAVRFQLKHNQPDLIIYALGANDGLRAISPDTTYRNILQTIEEIQKAKVKVILLGMKAPPNYGEKFPKDFEKIFARVASEKKIPFIPFFLEGVAGDSKLNQADGIHPNEKGYEVITGRMYPVIKGQL
ncbi:MAG: arylesterase [Oligoflexus sp.]|nr:arylesterase [Oligoflexus sp.]